jgi:hypothetical protein
VILLPTCTYGYLLTAEEGDMIEKGKTPHEGEKLSEKTGIPTESTNEYVKLSDLSGLSHQERQSQSYFDAGADTPDKMVNWDIDELGKMLASLHRKNGI